MEKDSEENGIILPNAGQSFHGLFISHVLPVIRIEASSIYFTALNLYLESVQHSKYAILLSGTMTTPLFQSSVRLVANYDVNL